MIVSQGQSRYAAPRENRAALIVPTLENAGLLAAENVRLRSLSEYDVQGRSLAALSSAARQEMLAAARSWTSAYREVNLPSIDPQGLIFVAGHQPELFHPGVWFKNFALGMLARTHGAAAVNLVIDSDAIKSNTLLVPGGSLADPRREAIPFDRADSKLPFEERRILDRAAFSDFGRRIAQRIAPLVGNPLIERFWPMVIDRSNRVDRLGYCLAQARHQLEGEWGLQTLEIPQSWVCRSEPFQWFVAHLLGNLERFRECYNRAVQEYRQANGIRNAAHPVPDLATDGAWMEAPLWVWTDDQPHRRRVFARREGGNVIIADRAGQELRLPLKPDGDAGDAVGMLMDWNRRGVKIRSRALVTTLWARLVLSDLFLHGIGGGKYDQVTDRLIETFFDRQPPGIMVVSATLHLPVQRPNAKAGEIQGIRNELRELTYHPEKFLRSNGLIDSEIRPSNGNSAATLMAAKEKWIYTTPTPENARTRWASLSRINRELQPLVADRRNQLLEAQSQTWQALRCDKVLGSREYGFCLYPEEYLREFLDALLPKTA